MYCVTLWQGHQEASNSLEYTMKMYLADIFYCFGESPTSIFPIYFGYINFLLHILLRTLQDQFQYLTYQKKFIVPSSRDILFLYPIYLERCVEYGTFFTNRISSPNFAYIATEKPRSSQKIQAQKHLYYHLVDHFFLL